MYHLLLCEFHAVFSLGVIRDCQMVNLQGTFNSVVFFFILFQDFCGSNIKRTISSFWRGCYIPFFMI